MQPVETDNEVAKREALAEALTTFCNVVRKTRRSSPEDPELLNSAGKLSMEHIIPIYRVSRACMRLQHEGFALQSLGCLAASSVQSILPQHCCSLQTLDLDLDWQKCKVISMAVLSLVSQDLDHASDRPVQPQETLHAPSFNTFEGSI